MRILVGLLRLCSDGVDLLRKHLRVFSNVVLSRVIVSYIFHPGKCDALGEKLQCHPLRDSQDEFANNRKMLENHKPRDDRFHGFKHRTMEVVVTETVDRLPKTR